MASSKLARCDIDKYDEDIIQELLTGMKNLQLEMKLMKEDHRKEMDELFSRHKAELEKIVESMNILENQAWYKKAWKQFKELSLLQKALVILILGLITASTIWATVTFASWAFPYVVTFVTSTYTYLTEVYTSAANYLMSCPWFAQAVKAGPAYCLEHGVEIAEAAALTAGISAGGITSMFLEQVKESKVHHKVQ